MKKFLTIIVLGLLVGCATNQSSVQNNSTIKSKKNFKVLEQSEDHIVIKDGKILYNNSPFKQPELIETARKYCEGYKKNTYVFWIKGNSFLNKPDPYWFDQFDYKGKGHLMICAKNQDDAEIVRDRFEKDNVHTGVRKITEFVERLSDDEIAKREKEKKEKIRLANLKIKKQRYSKIEKLYEKDCIGGKLKKGFIKGTPEYQKCIYDKDEQVTAERKSLEKKLAKMSQMERIEYQCENVFNFRKNSSKFKDCTLKVYVAESEAEKIRLEKELIQAKLEVKRTRELEQQATLLAQRDQNNTQSLGSFLDLITLGLQIYSLTSPVPSAPAAAPTKALQCFTSGMFEYCS